MPEEGLAMWFEDWIGSCIRYCSVVTKKMLVRIWNLALITKKWMAGKDELWVRIDKGDSSPDVRGDFREHNFLHPMMLHNYHIRRGKSIPPYFQLVNSFCISRKSPISWKRRNYFTQFMSYPWICELFISTSQIIIFNFSFCHKRERNLCLEVS